MGEKNCALVRAYRRIKRGRIEKVCIYVRQKSKPHRQC